MNSSGPQSSGNSSASSSSGTNVQEYSIKVPKNTKKKFNIMRFNGNLNIDFSKWTNVKMERENNQVEKHLTEEMPKYGAGSEYRREEKDDARKKRLGFASRRYNPDDQPWILKIGGKNGKKFKGIREGGVAENAAFYIFTHGSDGSIEAYPAAEWYNFQPIQRFKALSAEEAEQEFGRRNKSLNYFNLMMRKRFRKDEDDDIEEEGNPKKKGVRDLKISDMDDWVNSDEDEVESGDEGSDEEKETKKKKKLAAKKKTAPKKKVNSDESAFEESDDGDEEGRELDYISDSSENVSDSETKVDEELKGVDQEDALRKLLNSDEDDEDEENKNEDGNKSDQEELPPNEEPSPPGSAVKKKKKKDSLANKSSGDAGKIDDTSSDFSADSSDSDNDRTKKDCSFDNSQPSTVAESAGGSEPAAKRPRLDSPGESCISEEAVRRYLTRKPMTTIELLQKFRKFKTSSNSQKLVDEMTQILKKINPIKQTIKDKMYLSLKPENQVVTKK